MIAFLKRVASQRFIQFAAVGFSGVFVNLGLLYLFAERARMGENLSSGLAIELSIIWNFLLNNWITFRDKNADAHSGFLSRLLRYNLVGLVGLAIQLGAAALMRTIFMHAMHLVEIGFWRYPSQLVGIVLAIVWNFATNFFWTWRQKAPTEGRVVA
jgi:dolichol-phosphate mannosyltransferase